MESGRVHGMLNASAGSSSKYNTDSTTPVDNQGNVRQGDDRASRSVNYTDSHGAPSSSAPQYSLLPNAGIPLPGVYTDALSGAPFTSLDQRGRMINEIMQMQQRMPFIPAALPPHIYQPRTLEELTDPRSAEAAYMAAISQLPTAPVKQPPFMPSMSLAGAMPPAPSVTSSERSDAPSTVVHSDTVTRQADKEVCDINSVPEDEESLFQAQRKRHASAPDNLAAQWNPPAQGGSGGQQCLSSDPPFIHCLLR